MSRKMIGVKLKTAKKDQLFSALLELAEYWLPDEEGNFGELNDVAANFPTILLANDLITEEFHDKWVNSD